MKDSSDQCCTPLHVQDAPKGLYVGEIKCETVSCGGACWSDSVLILVPESNRSSSRVETIHCVKNFSADSAVQIPGGCDEVTSTSKKFEIAREGQKKLSFRDGNWLLGP